MKGRRAHLVGMGGVACHEAYHVYFKTLHGRVGSLILVCKGAWEGLLCILYNIGAWYMSYVGMVCRAGWGPYFVNILVTYISCLWARKVYGEEVKFTIAFMYLIKP